MTDLVLPNCAKQKGSQQGPEGKQIWGWDEGNIVATLKQIKYISFRAALRIL